jgi:tripartite-type tricarboxylate transporter receptor subunit TctC
MNFSRRTALVLLAAAAGSVPALAEDRYPTKPVTVVVPQAPGGANDAIARIVAQKLSEQMGQQFIVDNRPGAGGNLGTAVAGKAKPDGYTLLLTVSSAHVINPSLYKSPGFDPVKDFEPITPVATAGYALVANNNFPANNVSEMIAVAKKQPGKIAIASAGNGTLNHLIGEMLQKAAGIELMHVPYKGASAAVTDLVGGQVQLSVQSLPSSISFIKSASSRCWAWSTRSACRRCPRCPPSARRSRVSAPRSGTGCWRWTRPTRAKSSLRWAASPTRARPSDSPRRSRTSCRSGRAS